MFFFVVTITIQKGMAIAEKYRVNLKLIVRTIISVEAKKLDFNKVSLS